MDLARLLDVPLPECREPRRQQTMVYLLRDRSGVVVAEHHRIDFPPGRWCATHKKDCTKHMWWRLPNATENGLGGRTVNTLPLYGGHELPDTTDEPVVVVEGEKARDALAARGIVAVGTVTGACAEPSHDVLRTLKGRFVVLWPDADGPGRAHMDKIARRPDFNDIRHAILDPWPDRDDGADAADMHPDQNVHALIMEAASETCSSSGALDLTGLRAVFAEWLLIEDDMLLEVIVGAVLAHRLGGDPVWPLIVAAPGHTKTEILRSLYDVPGIYPISEITSKTFASGLGGPKDKDPSLLSRLTEEILVLKDFTTVLKLRREDRQSILAQLREIYDGAFAKTWGTGRELRWAGRLGLIAGVTPVIDCHHGALAILGERFVLYRPSSPDRPAVAMKALRGAGREQDMRQTLRGAMTTFLAGRRKIIPTVTDDRLRELSIIADFITRARSGVERDSPGWGIAYSPEPESPTRFAKVMLSLARGVALANDHDHVGDHELDVVRRVALDSLPAIRRRILVALAAADEPSTTVDISTRVRAATQSTRRALEDLEALDVVTRNKGGKSHTWNIVLVWRDVLRGLRGDEYDTSSDFSGKVEPDGAYAHRSRKVRGGPPTAPRRPGVRSVAARTGW
jgi:hypothetical protein